MSRFKACGFFEHAVSFFTPYSSQDRWSSGHGCLATALVEVVQAAMDQDGSARQPGGLGYLGWFASHDRRAHSRVCRFDHLWTEPDKVENRSSLSRKMSEVSQFREKSLADCREKVREELIPRMMVSEAVNPLW